MVGDIWVAGGKLLIRICSGKQNRLRQRAIEVIPTQILPKNPLLA
jgi:hypothetical protein